MRHYGRLIRNVYQQRATLIFKPPVSAIMKLPDLGFFADARNYFDNVRMQDWGGYVGMAILGYLQGIETVPTTSSDYLRMAIYLISVALYLGFSFSVNNC